MYIINISHLVLKITSPWLQHLLKYNSIEMKQPNRANVLQLSSMDRAQDGRAILELHTSQMYQLSYIMVRQ